MIPKVIHYCWFGGNPLPELAKKCIDSWKKYCPDYEIIRWDETNFDLNFNDYVREAYEAKKWAFVSDVARLYALVNYGGIYMDTDVEVLKPLDTLLNYDAVSGFENETAIAAGLMAACKGQKMFVELLHDYGGLHFKQPDGTIDQTTIVARVTNKCLEYGFMTNNKMQTVHGFTLLPKDYLYPKDYRTRRVTITKNTLVIHHYDGSWLSPEGKYVNDLTAKLQKILPGVLSNCLAQYIGVVKFHNIRYANRVLFRWIKRGRNRSGDKD